MWVRSHETSRKIVDQEIKGKKKKKKDKQAKRTFSMDKENNFSYATMINHQRRKEFFGLAQRGR